EKVNLIFFKLNSPGGQPEAADAVADLIANLKGIKTVAFVDDNAVGVAALIALACDEIVFREGGRMGDVRPVDGLDDRLIRGLAQRAEDLAKLKSHPPAVARAMVDPEAVVVEAKDTKTGAVVLVTQSQARAEPGRYLEQGVVKGGDGQPLE